MLSDGPGTGDVLSRLFESARSLVQFLFFSQFVVSHGCCQLDEINDPSADFRSNLSFGNDFGIRTIPASLS